MKYEIGHFELPSKLEIVFMAPEKKTEILQRIYQSYERIVQELSGYLKDEALADILERKNELKGILEGGKYLELKAAELHGLYTEARNIYSDMVVTLNRCRKNAEKQSEYHSQLKEKIEMIERLIETMMDNPKLNGFDFGEIGGGIVANKDALMSREYSESDFKKLSEACDKVIADYFHAINEAKEQRTGLDDVIASAREEGITERNTVAEKVGNGLEMLSKLQAIRKKNG